MCAVAVIPARFGSTRFPGKVLADRTGKPLIQHVYERAVQAKRVRDVIIACDDDRIIRAAHSFNARAVSTSVEHPNGTSRIAEAVDLLDVQDDIIVNVQGDEPDLNPDLIDRAVEVLEERPECAVSTVCAPFERNEDPTNPNIVKVVIDTQGRALYFSRSRIPHPRDTDSDIATYKHIGLYVYRRDFLRQYVQLAPTPLERAEKLEQLRILEHGYRIAVAVGEGHSHGIDTPEQYDAWVRSHSSER